MVCLLLAALLAASPAAKTATTAKEKPAAGSKETRGASKGAPAPTGTFIDCDISSGQPIRCGDTYQGRAVVETTAGIQECMIADGALTECDGPYQGRAVVPHEGIFQECDIGDGVVSRCNGWLDEGKGAVWKGQGKAVPPRSKRDEKEKSEKDCKDGKDKDGKKCDEKGSEAKKPPTPTRGAKKKTSAASRTP